MRNNVLLPDGAVGVAEAARGTVNELSSTLTKDAWGCNRGAQTGHQKALWIDAVIAAHSHVETRCRLSPTRALQCDAL
jgi:hypothetical protein